VSAGPRAWAREIQPLVAVAEAAGWTVTRSGRTSHHWKFRDPGGALRAVTGSTPRSTRRTLANLRADLRRAGLDV
jgi:hypothetical protein